MDRDSAINTDSKEESQVEGTDDSCTTECVSGDWSAEVKQENLTVVKQEPDDVCWIIQFITIKKMLQILGNRSLLILVDTLFRRFLHAINIFFCYANFTVNSLHIVCCMNEM